MKSLPSSKTQLFNALPFPWNKNLKTSVQNPTVSGSQLLLLRRLSIAARNRETSSNITSTGGRGFSKYLKWANLKKKMFNYNSCSFSFPIELHKTRSENRISSQNVHEGKQYLFPIITSNLCVQVITSRQNIARKWKAIYLRQSVVIFSLGSFVDAYGEQTFHFTKYSVYREMKGALY